LINPPSEKTLKKYGLSAGEWLDILELQGGVCPICRKVPQPPKKHPERGGRFCIDHAHVPRWKHLPPEKRKLFVRGLLCWFCNDRFVGRSITIQKSENVTAYLKAHEERVIQHVMRSRP
jgi:hypothetical protein